MGKKSSRNKARANTLKRNRRSNFIKRDIPKPVDKVSIMPRGLNTVTGPLLSYLEEHRGEQVTLPEIKNAIECSDNQIRASLSYLRGKNFAIDTVVTGQCWIYRAAPTKPVVEKTNTEEVVKPTPKPTPPPMIMPNRVETNEYLRVVDRSDERLILIDVRGKIYKAVEI